MGFRKMKALPPGLMVVSDHTSALSTLCVVRDQVNGARRWQVKGLFIRCFPGITVMYLRGAPSLRFKWQLIIPAGAFSVRTFHHAMHFQHVDASRRVLFIRRLVLKTISRSSTASAMFRHIIPYLGPPVLLPHIRCINTPIS